MLVGPYVLPLLANALDKCDEVLLAAWTNSAESRRQSVLETASKPSLLISAPFV